jgi:hypothetical protein
MLSIQHVPREEEKTNFYNPAAPQKKQYCLQNGTPGRSFLRETECEL